MNGNEAYENEYKHRVQVIFDKNKDLKELQGFYYYIHDMSCSSAYTYVNYVKMFLRSTNKKVKDLTLDDYTMFLSSVSKHTASYQIAVYSALNKFSIYLKATHQNDENSMQYISRPRFREDHKTTEKREIGYLKKNEIDKYLENVMSDDFGTPLEISRRKRFKERDLAIILLFLNTGMRCSALYKLNIENIDFQKKMLFTIDKGSKVQEYDLSDKMLLVLKKWIDKRKEIVDPNESALFVSGRGNRLMQISISDVVKKYAANINGKHITPHKLRATYGTALYNKTKDVYFVQQCMGHSSPKTTEMYIRGEKATARSKAKDIMENITKI